jgi:hypothetical protein
VLARVQRFGGACELCCTKPEWTTVDGLPHYQAHHLSADIDAVDWIAGVCGTCHDRLHHSVDREEATIRLRKVVADRHKVLGHPVSIVDMHHAIIISDEYECFSPTL